jgi:hypothetical protein
MVLEGMQTHYELECKKMRYQPPNEYAQPAIQAAREVISYILERQK